MKLNKISSAFNATKYTNKNLSIFGAALTAVLTMPTYAVAQETQAEEEIEVIQVTGMAGSMKEAARIKRTDARIVDALVAEDIGKLPDNNLAEALQRVTGVSINTDFGVGDSISIRGLPQNRVELNGRSTLGDSRDGVSLQDFPSSFLKTVEVVKSPTAEMIEGALGGTISMSTVRPLELDGLTGAVSLDGEYADKTENWAPIFNASIGDNWDLGESGTFGALAMISYQDREIRQDEYFNRVRLYDEDVNGMEANTPSGRFAVREQNTIEQYVETRERTAFNASLQWAPQSAEGMFFVDINFTDRSGDQEGNSILDVGGSRVYNSNTTQDGNGQVNNFALEGAFVIPKTWSSFRETESYSHALGGEWNFGDTIKVSGEVSIANSDSSEPATELNLRPVNHTAWNEWYDNYVPGDSYDAGVLRHTVDADFSQSGDKLPSIVYSDPLAMTSPENLAIREFRHDEVSTENDEVAARFDIEIDEPFDVDFLTSIKAGVRATENDYKYKLERYRTGDMYRGVVYNEGTAEEKPHTVWIDDPIWADSFTVRDHANSFDQMGRTGQNDLLPFASYNDLSNSQATFDKVYATLKDTNKQPSSTELKDVLENQEGAYRDITEETRALYVQANLDFDIITAVVGGRYVETDIDSSVYVDGEIVTGNHDYSDFLPSLNVTYNFSEETLFRFAAAKVMRRADYNELSPAFEIDNSFYTATQGALDLDPYRATQYDLSVEHYFGEGNMISFAVFYKDVESFLSESNTCRTSSQTSNQNVTEWESICTLNTAGEDNPDLVYGILGTPGYETDTAGFATTEALRDQGLTGINTSKVTNGENGTVEGIEIGYQQFFDFLPGAFSGLGVSANYTYADSEQPNGNALLDISENTFNGQVFWEYDGFALRVAYNYRDEFLDTEEETRVQTVGGLALNSSTNDESSDLYDPTAGNNYRDSRGQFDASASWDINENFTLVANAVNFTGEPSIYKTELGSNWKYTEADRRYTIGVRAKF